MKETIDEKPYNTEKAERLAEAENGYNEIYFKHTYQALYRSPSGQLFMHELTSIWKGEEDNYTRNRTSPIDEKEAFQFCIENQLIEQAQKFFPQFIEEG